MDDKLYYSIGEVSELLGVAPSVLRFWETEFDQLHPVRNRRGVRSYTRRDVELLQRIHYLTRDCGYTLDGVKEQLRLNNNTLDDRIQIAQTLNDAKQFLLTLKDYL